MKIIGKLRDTVCTETAFSICRPNSGLLLLLSMFQSLFLLFFIFRLFQMDKSIFGWIDVNVSTSATSNYQ